MTARHTTTPSVGRDRADARRADAVADASVWSMDAAETAATLVELTRLEAQVGRGEGPGRRARRRPARRPGRRRLVSAANWLAHTTKQTRPAAHGTVKLGHDLESTPPPGTPSRHGDVRGRPGADDHPLGRPAPRGGRRRSPRQGRGAPARAGQAPRREDAEPPRQAPVRGDRPRRGRRPRSQLLEAEEAAAWAKTYFTRLRRRPRQGHGTFAMPIASTARPEEDPARDHRAQAPGRHRRRRRRTPAHPGGDGPGVLRAHHPLPRQEAPQDRRPQRHLARPHRRGLPDGPGREGRGPRHRREDQPRRWPAGWPARPGSSRSSWAATPSPSTSAAGGACTPSTSATPSSPATAAAAPKAATAPPASTPTTRPAGPTAATPTSSDGITLCHWHHAKAHDTSYQTTYLPNGDVTFHRRR